MKCSIDNKCPRAASHIKTKAKKNALMEDRFAQIETENRILLEKMSHIMRVSFILFLHFVHVDLNLASHHVHIFLTLVQRWHRLHKRQCQVFSLLGQGAEKARIATHHQGEQKILKRIQNARPTYNHKRWEEEAKKSQDILQNICEFKPQPARRKEEQDEDSIFGYMDFYDSIPE